MSDPNTGEPRMDDPIETGLDGGTGDPSTSDPFNALMTCA
jgi:hypothetical protein